MEVFSKKSSNDIDREKNSFEKLKNQIKTSLFGVFFVMLKEDDTPLPLIVLMELITFFQILFFPFHESITHVWKDETIIHYISLSQEIWQLAFYFKLTTWTIYITVFYLLITLIGLVVVDIFYVSYSFTRKKFAFIWPLQVLRVILSLFITFLFLPILDYFIGVIGCIKNPNTGTYVHHAFPEIECYTPTHLIHIIFAILISLFFVILSFVVGLCYFECKPLSHDVTSRWNARWLFFYNLYEMYMIFLYAFLYGEQYDYLLLFSMLLGSLVIFFKYFIDYPYYSNWFGKFWGCLVHINLWSVIMAWFAKLLEGNLFQGSVYAYLIGLCFIIIICIQSTDHRINYLLKDIAKFQSSREVITKVNYLYKLMAMFPDDKDAFILLDGYFEIHKNTCQNEDCPLKLNKNKLYHPNVKLEQGMTKEKLIIEEKKNTLISLMNELFIMAVKKFPKNSMLRITYAYFLKDFKSMKKQALQQLAEAEKCKLFFDEEFLIYQHRKNIEDEVSASSTDSGSMDILSEIATQNHLLQIQKNIEKSAFLYMDFWSQVSESNPDITFLSTIASKISTTVTRIEEHWKKLQRVSPDMPQALKMYGRFIAEVLNDKKLGEQYIQKSKIKMTLNKAKNKGEKGIFDETEILDTTSVPTIIISGETNKLGIITGANLAASTLFGYIRSEIINRNVKMLMPSLYASQHDNFIEAYLQDSEEPNMINTEFIIFGKHKSNYVFPCMLTVRVLNSDGHDIRFIGTFRYDKYFKNVIYLLINTDGTFDSFSALALPLLGLDIKDTTSKKKISIIDYRPDFFKEREEYMDKNNQAVISFNVDNPEYRKRKFKCFLWEIILKKQHTAYAVKLDYIENKKEKIKKAKQLCAFQFRYDFEKRSIIGDLYGGSSSHEFTTDIVSYRTSQVSEDGRSFRGDQPEKEGDTNYGDGIEIKRLYKGEIIDVVPEMIEEENDANDLSSKLDNFRPKIPVPQLPPKNSNNLPVRLIKSKEHFHDILNHKVAPHSIRWFKIAVIFSCIFFSALGFIEYTTISTMINKTNILVEILKLFAFRISNFGEMLIETQILTLINQNLVTFQNSTYINTDYIYSNINQMLDELQTNEKTITNNFLQLNLYENGYMDLREILVSYNFNDAKDGKGNSFQAGEVVDQLIGRFHDVVSLPLEDMYYNNTIITYLTINLLNNAFTGLNLAQNDTINKLSDTLKHQNQYCIYINAAFGIMIILICFFLYWMLITIRKIKKNILKLFLDIPEKIIRDFYERCEKFVSKIQINDDDLSDEDDFEDGEDMPTLKDDDKYKQKKKPLESGKNNLKTLARLGVTIVLLLVFFSMYYYLDYQLFTNYNKMSNELKTMTDLEIYSCTIPNFIFYYLPNFTLIAFLTNAVIAMIAVKGQPILNGDPMDKTSSTLDTLYVQEAELQRVINFIVNNNIHKIMILQENSLNYKFLRQSFIEPFDQIMVEEACSRLDTLIKQTSCKNFESGILLQGFRLGVIDHFERIRFIISTYNDTLIQNSSYFESLENVQQFFSSDTYAELLEFQMIYFRDIIRILANYLDQSMDEFYRGQMSIKIALVLIFVVMNVLGILIFLIPFLDDLSKDFWGTRYMLSLVPLKVIQDMDSIRIFLKKYIQDYKFLFRSC